MHGSRHQPLRMAGVVGRLASGGVGEQADRVPEGALQLLDVLEQGSGGLVAADGGVGVGQGAGPLVRPTVPAGLAVCVIVRPGTSRG